MDKQDLLRNPLLDDDHKHVDVSKSTKALLDRVGNYINDTLRKIVLKQINQSVEREECILDKTSERSLRNDEVCPKCGSRGCLSPEQYRREQSLVSDSARGSALLLRSCSVRQQLNKMKSMNIKTGSGKTVWLENGVKQQKSCLDSFSDESAALSFNSASDTIRRGGSIRVR